MITRLTPSPKGSWLQWARALALSLREIRQKKSEERNYQESLVQVYKLNFSKLQNDVNTQLSWIYICFECIYKVWLKKWCFYAKKKTMGLQVNTVEPCCLPWLLVLVHTEGSNMSPIITIASHQRNTFVGACTRIGRVTNLGKIFLPCARY